MTINQESYQGPIVLKHRMKTERMEGFEFEIQGSIMVCDKNEVDASYFRFEIHQTDERYVVVASPDEYFIFEEASWCFDLDYIEAECRKQWEEGNVDDSSEQYIAFLQECEISGEYSL
ncbi:hypothetical protein [Viridibacillus arvi]|uniref:hypothetical protein n=1 Tax=Viridibacillus arvi TaxID=263475 RepID=UPI0034CD257A